MSSSPIYVMVIVEGRTELLFVSKVLAPHLASRGVYLTPAQVSKPGQKGGDVKFSRMQRDVGSFLKQRADTYVTTCVDFYGIGNDWPGLAEAKLQSNPANRAMTLNDATKVRIVDSYAELRASSRFIPHVSMYEFESLLFSDPQILADRLRISSNIVEDVINKCGEPENINDSPDSAPSKRLSSWRPSFRKTIDGIAIAELIGLNTMRRRCPIFNSWLLTLEALNGVDID